MVLAKAVERRGGLFVLGTGSMPFLFGKEACQGPQRGEDMCGICIANLTTVLVVGAISDIVVARFDGPVSTHNTQQQFGILPWVWQRPDAGNGGDRFLALDPGRQIRETPVNENYLSRTTEAEFFSIRCPCPQFPEFQPSVLFFICLGLRRMMRGEKRLAVAALFPARRVDSPSR